VYNPTYGLNPPYIPPIRITDGVSVTKTEMQKNTTLQIAESKYWTSSVDENGKPISITTNDAKREPNKSSKKFCVRCVKNP